LSDLGQQLVVFVIAVVFTTAIAAISWRVYEKPFLRLKRYFRYEDRPLIMTDRPTPATLTPAGSV
jgi:peptidoglycan/LPS O-acetylase OafA/YrhL